MGRKDRQQEEMERVIYIYTKQTIASGRKSFITSLFVVYNSFSLPWIIKTLLVVVMTYLADNTLANGK